MNARVCDDGVCALRTSIDHYQRKLLQPKGSPDQLTCKMLHRLTMIRHMQLARVLLASPLQATLKSLA